MTWLRLLVTGAVSLLRDKRGIRDFRVRHTWFFYNHLYSKIGWDHRYTSRYPWYSRYILKSKLSSFFDFVHFSSVLIVYNFLYTNYIWVSSLVKGHNALIDISCRNHSPRKTFHTHRDILRLYYSFLMIYIVIMENGIGYSYMWPLVHKINTRIIIIVSPL